MTQLMSSVDEQFWTSDLEVIERSFLGGRTITDLPVFLDDRVAPQGRINQNVTTNVDREVAAFVARHRDAKMGANWFDAIAKFICG